MELSAEVERSLFRIGSGSFAVTLPIRWVRHHHLRPGDKVEIVIDDDLLIRPKQSSPRQKLPKEVKKQSFYRLRFSILARDGFRCRYCGRSPQEDGVKLAVDHILPLSKGGTNEPSNLITSCVDCNRGKGALLLQSIDLGAQLNKDLTN